MLFYLIPFLYRSVFPVKQQSKEGKIIICMCDIPLLIFFVTDLTIQCVENFLRAYHTEIENSDASIWISPFLNHQTTAVSSTANTATTANINELARNTFLPFIGNGRLAISPITELEYERRFHIRGRRTLDVPISFDPIVNVDEFGTHSKCNTFT